MIDANALCKVMQSHNFTTKSLSDFSDVPEDTIKNLRYGRARDPKISTLIKLADALECTIDELVGRDLFQNKDNLFLERYKSLPKPSQQFVSSILNLEYHLTKTYNDASPFKREVVVFIPVGNMEDGMIYSSSNFTHVDVRDYTQLFCDIPISCGIYISNNTYAPVYHAGDILLLSSTPPRSGDIITILHKPTQRLYIRKYYAGNIIALEPINQYGTTIYIDNNNESEIDNWHILGNVLTRMREINLAFEK